MDQDIDQEGIVFDGFIEGLRSTTSFPLFVFFSTKSGTPREVLGQIIFFFFNSSNAFFFPFAPKGVPGGVARARSSELNSRGGIPYFPQTVQLPVLGDFTIVPNLRGLRCKKKTTVVPSPGKAGRLNPNSLGNLGQPIHPKGSNPNFWFQKNPSGGKRNPIFYKREFIIFGITPPGW